MSRHFSTSVTVVAAAAIWSLAASVTVMAQPVLPPVGEPGWTPPRAAWGDPLIEGDWRQRSNITTYSIQRGREDRDEHTRIGGQRPALGEPVQTEDGLIPYLPWAKRMADFLYEQHFGAWTAEYLDPVSRGFMEGLPRITYQGGAQIHQFPDRIVIVYEYAHHYRVIPTDGRPHIPSNIKLWMGDSRGRWEGDTLIIDVTNNNDHTWLDIVGSFHSDQLTMEERWTVTGPERIDVEVILTDPVVYREPWSMKIVLGRAEYQEQFPSEVYEGQTITNATELSVRPPK